LNAIEPSVIEQIIELNRTPQQSETRTSFIRSETKLYGQKSYSLASILNTSATGKISDRAEVKLTILEAVVKGYYECSFAVHVGDKFVVKQKRGDRGPALRVTDEDRGQLGHLHFTYLSLTLALLVNTQLESEFLPILLRVNAYQFCIPFRFSTEQNRTNRAD